MSEQTAFAFPKPKRARPSPLVEHDRTRREQIAAARIVLLRPDVYGPGLVRWAELVFQNDGGTPETKERTHHVSSD